MKQAANAAADYLSRQRLCFERNALSAAAKPSKSMVHQLRVATRRARAGLAGVPKLKPPRNLRRRLRRLGKALGRVRELDVAITDARHYGLGTGKLNRKRKQLARGIKGKLLKDAPKIDRELKTAAEELAHEQNLRFDFRSLRARLRKWQARPIADSRGAHELRILAKKARYALELAQQDSAPLEELQEILGRDHDLEVLQELKGRKRAIRKDQKKQRRKAMRIAPRALAFALSHLESK